MCSKKLLFCLLLFGLAIPSRALNVKITSAGGYQADGAWLTVATAMGYTASIVPAATLNDTSFFPSTDILIVSTGVNPIAPVQIATIQTFLQSGKSVYLQGEYQSSMPGNQAFSQLVNALGGSFSWGASLTGNLLPSVTGSLGSTNLNVSSLPFFFYGCGGTASCHLTAFLQAGNTPVGWMFIPPATGTGRLIFTTDQDWVGASAIYTTGQVLMKNILSHLGDRSLGDQSAAPSVSISVNPGAVICAGSQASFTATVLNAGLSPVYQWTKNNLPAGSNGSSYTTTGLQNNDVIRCTVSSCAATSLSNTISMTVHTPDTVTVSDTICASQLPYTWNGMTVTAGGNAAAAWTTSSLLTGCDSVILLNLTVAPEYNETIDTFLCPAETPLLWAGQSLNTGGSYTHTFTSVSGCDSIVTLNLFLYPAAVTTNLDRTACGSLSFEGNLYTQSTVLQDTLFNLWGCDSVYRTIDLEVVQPVYDTIYGAVCAGNSLSFAGGYYSTEGLYPYRSTAVSGCDSYSVLSLEVHSLPDISISLWNNETLCIGDTLRLSGSGARDYEWRYDGNLFGTEADARMPVTGYTATVILTGKDDFGCSDMKQLSLEAGACCALQMPNAFTPNGDGLNDYFVPVTNGHPELFRMTIFNRWGAEIYKTEQSGRGWDGTVNGSPAETGTYFYRITGKCINGIPLKEQGDLILIR